jgi:hypothetical protein
MEKNCPRTSGRDILYRDVLNRDARTYREVFSMTSSYFFGFFRREGSE